MGFFDRFKIPTNVGKHNPNDSETTKLLPNDKIYKKPTNVGQHDPINSEIIPNLPKAQRGFNTKSHMVEIVNWIFRQY